MTFSNQAEKLKTVKLFNINYGKLFKMTIEPDEDVIMQHMPNSFNANPYEDLGVMSRLKLLNCFSINKDGFITFTGAVGLVRNHKTKTDKLIVSDSKDHALLIESLYENSLYGLDCEPIVIRRQFTFAEAIIANYIPWLKEQEQLQSLPLSESQYAKLLVDKTALFTK